MQIKAEREELANSIDMLAAISGHGDFSGLDEVHIKAGESGNLFLSLFGPNSCVRSRIECEVKSPGECTTRVKPIKGFTSNLSSEFIEIKRRKNELHLKADDSASDIRCRDGLPPNQIGSMDWFQPELSVTVPIANLRALLSRTMGFWDDNENPYGVVFNALYIWLYPNKIVASSFSNNKMAAADFGCETGLENKIELAIHYKLAQNLYAMLKFDEGAVTISWNSNCVLIKTDQHEFYCRLCTTSAPAAAEQFFSTGNDFHSVSFVGKEAKTRLAAIGSVVDGSDSGILVKVLPNEIRFLGRGDAGESYTRIAAESSYQEEMITGFMFGILYKIMSGNQTVIMRFKSPQDRAVFSYKDDEMNARYVLLPIRLN